MAVSDTTVLILLVSLVSLFCYIKISKFFGSMGIFLTGIGAMYSMNNTNNTWMGMIIAFIGFLMIIYSLLEKPRRK